MSTRAAVRGFTLLEVVVAIALFAITLGVMYAGMSTAVRAYDAAELRTESASRMRVVNAFVRRTLGGAIPLAVPVQRDWELLFAGDAHSVRFVADLPGYVGVGGLHEIVFEIGGEAQRGLLMHRRPLAIDERGTLAGEFDTRVLADGIDAVQLRFFGSDDARTPATWRNDWPAGKRMPELVEIRISDARAQWPAMVVRPRIDALRYQGAGAVVPGVPSPRAAPGPGAPSAPAGAAPAPGAPGAASPQVPAR